MIISVKAIFVFFARKELWDKCCNDKRYGADMCRRTRVRVTWDSSLGTSFPYCTMEFWACEILLKQNLDKISWDINRTPWAQNKKKDILWKFLSKENCTDNTILKTEGHPILGQECISLLLMNKYILMDCHNIITRTISHKISYRYYNLIQIRNGSWINFGFHLTLLSPTSRKVRSSSSSCQHQFFT